MAVVDDNLQVRITAGVVVDEGSISRAQARLRQGFSRAGGGAGAFRPAAEGLGRMRQTLNEAAKPASQLSQFLNRIRARATETWHLGGLGRAAQRIGDIGAQAKGAVEQLGKLGGAFGLGGVGAITAAAGGAGFGALMAGYARAGTEIGLTSQALGISPRQLQIWRQAASRAGLAPEAATGALTGLVGTQYYAQYGRAEAGPAITAANLLGISREELLGDPNKLLVTLARKMVGQAPMVKRQIAAAFHVEDLFGLLQQGPEAVQRYLDESAKLVAIQDADIAKTRELTDAFAGAQNATTSLGYAIAGQLTPVFKPLLTTYTEWLGKLQQSPAAMEGVSIGVGVLAAAFGITLVSAVGLAVARLNAFWALPAIRGLWALRGLLGELAVAVPLGVEIGKWAHEKNQQWFPPKPGTSAPTGFLKSADDWAKWGLQKLGIIPPDAGDTGAGGGGGGGYGPFRGAPTNPNIRPGIGSGSDPRGMIPVIRAAAIANGVDPDVAVAVARSEGLGAFLGDRGTSGGAFQLHVQGGLGDVFRADTGLDPLDPKNEVAGIWWAMGRLKQTGWSPYHGARGAGIAPWEGISGDGGSETAAAPTPAPAPAPAPAEQGGSWSPPGSPTPAEGGSWSPPVPAQPADTNHRVSVDFTNAPQGTRMAMRGEGPAELQLRTQYAMATV